MANNAIEAKVDQLADQIKTLTSQLNQQHKRLTSLEKAWSERTVKNFAAVPPSTNRGIEWVLLYTETIFLPDAIFKPDNSR